MIDREKQSGLTQELIIILEELEDADLSSFDIINRGNRLKNIYISDSGEPYRHSYSEITDYMYRKHKDSDNIPTPDPGCVILDHLKEIADNWGIEKDCPEKELLCNAIQKLIDHVNLEVVRLSQMADIYYKLTQTDLIRDQMSETISGVREVADSLKEQQKAVEEMGEQLKIRRQEVEEIQIDVKNHNTQAITVLSIFSCVVFAFTGGFSLITGALGVLPETTRTKAPFLVGILLMLSTVLVDTVYMLLRAAKHYSNTTNGHLRGFVICNAICAVIAFGLMAAYYFVK